MMRSKTHFKKNIHEGNQDSSDSSDDADKKMGRSWDMSRSNTNGKQFIDVLSLDIL